MVLLPGTLLQPFLVGIGQRAVRGRRGRTPGWTAPVAAGRRAGFPPRSRRTAAAAARAGAGPPPAARCRCPAATPGDARVRAAAAPATVRSAAACGAAADSEGERRAGLGLPCLHLLVGFHQDRAHEAVGGGIQRKNCASTAENSTPLAPTKCCGSSRRRISRPLRQPRQASRRRAPPPAGSRVAAGLLSAGGRWRRRAGCAGRGFPASFEGARTFHQREVVEGQLRDQSPARLAVRRGWLCALGALRRRAAATGPGRSKPSAVPAPRRSAR